MQKYKAANELYESKTTRGEKRSLKSINSIIIHTTGFGAGLRRLRDKYDGDLTKVGPAYAKRMANILKYKGHFLIDHTGAIYQFLPLSEVGWHTGSSKRRKLKDNKPPAWWIRRWKGFKKPTDLPSWKERSPNAVSVGIDLLAHGNGTLTPGYTDEQYEGLVKLIGALCKDFNIPLERKYIVGHEDVDPISRGSKNSGWDPGKFDWSKLMDNLQPSVEKETPQEDEATRGELKIEVPPVSRTGEILMPAPKMPMPSMPINTIFKWLHKFLAIIKRGQ